MLVDPQFTNLVTRHFDIGSVRTWVDFMINGIYHLYEFDNNHKILHHDTWTI